MKSSIQTMNSCEVILKKDDNITDTYVFSNITCNAWRSSLINRLIDFSGVNSWKWVAKYIALWTSATTATITDIQLGAEIVRVPVDTFYTSATTTVATVYALFPLWPSYTVNEAWIFLDDTATATANTGSLLAHSIFSSPIVKPSDHSLTIKWTISITNA